MVFSQLNKQLLVSSFLLFLFIAVPSFSSSLMGLEVKPKPMGKNLYRRIEPIILSRSNVTLNAKMDTGAQTSSLSATNIRVKIEEGSEFVVFDVLHPTVDAFKNIKLRVFKWIKIKKRMEEDCDGNILPYTRRPVVKMEVSLRGRVKTILVNLADRRNMNFPLLMGRSAIVKYRGVVDPL